ncbi:hypothetical protein LIER_35656 [Lithospermum erythrorhizon]|uniref:Uncharacterized protein n=1 Tax=Lithospermum erythrorhizon TaxID=34254 RepID=A0AAV3NU55_LITER
MKFRGYQRFIPPFSYNSKHYYQKHVYFTTLFRKVQSTKAHASNGASQGNSFLVPGATFATIVMFGALHARRLYNDNKIEEAREKGIELEFQPDAKVN